MKSTTSLGQMANKKAIIEDDGTAKALRAPMVQVEYPNSAVIDVALSSSGKSVGCMFQGQINGPVIIRDAADGLFYEAEFGQVMGWMTVKASSVRSIPPPQRT